jgi:hypothetical protein
MRRSQRLIAVAILAAMSVTLAGCGGGAFDPTDLMDWFDTKKKIPGERKPVFPEGVPGVEQGVPKELYKGAQQQEPPPPVAEAPPAPAPEPRAKRSAPKSTARSAPRSVAPAEPAQDGPDTDEGTAAAPPAPPPARPKRQRITAPPPDSAPPPQQQQAAPPAQSSPAPFPAPLPSGSFSR